MANNFPYQSYLGVYNVLCEQTVEKTFQNKFSIRLGINFPGMFCFWHKLNSAWACLFPSRYKYFQVFVCIQWIHVLNSKNPAITLLLLIFNSWKHFLETWVYRIGNISGLATHSGLLFYLSVFPFSISPIVACFCPSVCQAWYRNIDWDKAHLKPHPHTPLGVAISTCWKEWKLLQTIWTKNVLTQNSSFWSRFFA